MMPVIFVGHGSPMNAIEENNYTQGWKQIANSVPKPSAILSISAHWETNGTKVSTLENPETIHDFYGFPQELYDVEYKAAGDKATAKETLELLGAVATEDTSWGLDHGTWSVLRVMYPKADIPVFQVSINRNASPKEHYEIGEKIKILREKDVLIMGSGNVVHNLGILDFSIKSGYDWAYEFNEYIVDKIKKRDFEGVINYNKLGRTAHLAVPTSEHFNPLLYALGAVDERDELIIYNNEYVAGSLSMTSFVFGGWLWLKKR